MKKTDYNLAVYCGARSGNDPLFTTRAQELGTLCAQNNIGVVYGGGRTGLMGTVAGATLDAGGVVYGVVTHKLVGLEGVYPGQTTLDIVDTMHQRKIAMIDKADAFVAMPGGPGTLSAGGVGLLSAGHARPARARKALTAATVAVTLRPARARPVTVTIPREAGSPSRASSNRRETRWPKLSVLGS